MKRLLICAGGTAGHLFPAQALASQLDDVAITFIGSGLSSNRFFDRDRFAYREVSSGRLRPSGLVKLWRGYRESLAAIKEWNPHLVVGFGSFHAVPPLLAARRLGLPMVLHEGNAYPGKVNRLFSPYAQVTGLHFEMAKTYLRGRSQVVGVPLRPGHGEEGEERELILSEWGLEADRRTLLIFGGSQGARRINELIEGAAPGWRGAPLQIIHLTGDGPTADRVRRLYRGLGLPCYVRSFEPRMERAWRCADLVISRSGASSVAEQTVWAVPGLLIPYPYAADDHQAYNARHLEQLGGALVLPERSLTSEQLEEKVRALIEGPALALMRREMEANRNRQPDQFATLVRGYLSETTV